MTDEEILTTYYMGDPEERRKAMREALQREPFPLSPEEVSTLLKNKGDEVLALCPAQDTEMEKQCPFYKVHQDRHCAFWTHPEGYPVCTNARCKEILLKHSK